MYGLECYYSGATHIKRNNIYILLHFAASDRKKTKQAVKLSLCISEIIALDCLHLMEIRKNE